VQDSDRDGKGRGTQVGVIRGRENRKINLSPFFNHNKGEIMSIHSTILVHWTGKDIANTKKSQLYVERLKDDLKNGLFTKRTSEDSIRGTSVKNLLRICFSEIRLSQAQKHAKRYGELGIGFTREFMMNKGCRPVIYIPFDEIPDGNILEDSIRNLYTNLKDRKEIFRSVKWIMAHVKRMSNEKDEDYYEEMEWRIVHDESPDNKHFTKGKGDGVHRLKFTAYDIKVIIFPDEDTKQLSLKDEVIRKYFSKHIPTMVTLEDCNSF